MSFKLKQEVTWKSLSRLSEWEKRKKKGIIIKVYVSTVLVLWDDNTKTESKFCSLTEYNS